MLRIHFTADDLACVRIAAAPDPMWETVLSLHRLRDREGALVYGGWRENAARRVDRSVRLLLPLVPATGYFPDFLTPAEAALGPEAGVEAVMRTPRGRLRKELSHLASAEPLPAWTEAMVRGGTGSAMAMTRLGGALRRHHERVIAPHLPFIQAQVAAERSHRVRTLVEGGAEALLNGLRPLMRWKRPVLELDYPVARDVHLGGRGLLLVPSFFCRRRAVTLFDPELIPVLVYPIEHKVSAVATAGEWAVERERTLAHLLGRTRAGILCALDRASTTTELARRLGVSPASASQHAAVLREAGLISTRRNGVSVLHTLTPLGSTLLEGTPSCPR